MESNIWKERRFDDPRLEQLRLRALGKNETDIEIIENAIDDEDDDDQSNDKFFQELDEAMIKQNQKIESELKDIHFYEQKSLTKTEENPPTNVEIIPFSLKEEMNSSFDVNGNIIVEDEEEPENENLLDQIMEDEEKLPEMDENLALQSFQILIENLDNNETIEDAIIKLGTNDNDKMELITDAATNLLFMGINRIYTMSRNDLIDRQNDLIKKIHK